MQPGSYHQHPCQPCPPSTAECPMQNFVTHTQREPATLPSNKTPASSCGVYNRLMQKFVTPAKHPAILNNLNGRNFCGIRYRLFIGIQRTIQNDSHADQKCSMEKIPNNLWNTKIIPTVFWCLFFVHRPKDPLHSSNPGSGLRG